MGTSWIHIKEGILERGGGGVGPPLPTMGLASMVYKFFDKKSSGGGVATEPNYQLVNELHK